jgi:long-chain acyl-CoA synthetase
MDEGTRPMAAEPSAPETIPAMMERNARERGRLPAVKVKDENGRYRDITYGQIFDLTSQFTAGLLAHDVKAGDHVAIIGENRFEWLVCDLAILFLGAVTVPRGAEITLEELEYILVHSDSRAVIVEDQRQLEKVLEIKDRLPLAKLLVVMDEKYPGGHRGVHRYDDILDRGRRVLSRDRTAVEKRLRQVKPGDVAALFYTSGTTGQPKGVLLTHANIMYNVNNVPALVGADYRDRFLSILPPWHAYEYEVEKILFGATACLAYSQPVAAVILEDLREFKPTFFACVPRIWEAVYRGVMRKVEQDSRVNRGLFRWFMRIGQAYKKAQDVLKDQEPWFRRPDPVSLALRRAWAHTMSILLQLPYFLGDRMIFSKIRARVGGKLRHAVSGGGMLPRYLDDFFNAVGISILDAYGLTEAMVLTLRRPHRETRYTVGPVAPLTEIKLVDPDTGKEVPPGKEGLIHCRGPQVMAGYYKNEEETRRVLSKDGWLNTQDIARATVRGEYQILDREDDIIKLTNGEKVAPTPMEDELRKNPHISQVMIVGNARRYLTALIVPDFALLEEFAAKSQIAVRDRHHLLQDDRVQALFRQAINDLYEINKGYREYERIRAFHLLDKEFVVGEDMTHTLKLKRRKVHRKYQDEIERMYTAVGR